MAKWHPASGKWGIFGETSGSKQAKKASASIGRFLADLESRKEDVTSFYSCLLYTSPRPRELSTSLMPSSA